MRVLVKDRSSLLLSSRLDGESRQTHLPGNSYQGKDHVDWGNRASSLCEPRESPKT